MVASASSAWWFLPFVIPIACWAAYSDLSTMKIPNKSVVALLATFVLIGLIALPFAEYWPRLIHFPVVLLIGFVMNALRLLGAGDAKFAAAMAPFIAIGDLAFVLLLLAVCSALGFISHRLARLSPLRKAFPDWESWERMRHFPMGYPLAATLVIYLIFVAVR